MTVPVIRNTTRQARRLKGVPLTKEELQRARDAAAAVPLEGFTDIGLLMTECVRAHGTRLSLSARPAFIAEFFIAIAARQGTIVNHVTHHAVNNQKMEE